jgi:RimJ/RimL family protein N-acetyltransferase
MTVIKTKDFVLRPVRMGDAPAYLELHQNPEARKGFMSIPKNLKEAREELKKDSGKNNLMWAIEINGRFAGFIHLELNNNPKYKHSAIVGYCVHPSFRGMGLATRSLKLITSYAFNKLGLIRVSGMCRTFNKASARVLEKAGYKLEGILRKNKFKEGKYLDDMLWARVR